MNRKALTGIVIMAILAVAAWGEPITISVEEISAAYADSRYEANKKYKSFDLVVSGSFKRSSSSGDTITFHGGVSCLMKEGEESGALRLSEGDQVMVSGIGDGRFLGINWVKDCIFIGSPRQADEQQQDGDSAVVAADDGDPEETRTSSITPEHWEASLVGVWSAGQGDGYMRFYEEGSMILIRDNCSLIGEGQWRYEYGALTFYDSTGKNEVGFFNVLTVPLDPIPGDVLVLDTSREWMFISADPSMEC